MLNVVILFRFENVSPEEKQKLCSEVEELVVRTKPSDMTLLYEINDDTCFIVIFM